MMGKKAFTLIELLIVVAIIAILAAIAVPNFLEAQVRAKVSRAKADMRSAATALEAYYTDHNHYPFDGYNFPGVGIEEYNFWFLPKTLSTPISYLTSVGFIDPFRQEKSSPTHWQFGCLRYTEVDSTWGMTFAPIQSPARTTPSIYYAAMKLEWGGWKLQSAGPDRSYSPANSVSAAAAIASGGGWPGLSTAPPNNYPADQLSQPYDPTNGTASMGDVLRSQRSSTGYANAQ
jgi:prepilin-type N-terminal cleavage/methylation domain-containing protein